MSQELVHGRFRIGQVIGRGNMGEVHRAEDLHAPEGSPERTVAVKTILRSRTGARIDTSDDAKAVQRFSREVLITRRPRHPNLTRLVAGGIDERAGGLPFLAMEFLDGETLRDLVEEESQLPVSWAAAIGAQIAAGPCGAGRLLLPPVRPVPRRHVLRTRHLQRHPRQRHEGLRHVPHEGTDLAEYDRMADAGPTLENPLVDGENYTSTLTPRPGHGPRHPA